MLLKRGGSISLEAEVCHYEISLLLIVGGV
jgi:hypothetical protein